jgi:energy-coupling factor transporter ATP-binding protein EcfA2
MRGLRQPGRAMNSVPYVDVPGGQRSNATCYNVNMLSRLYATNYRCLVNFEFKPTTKQLIIGRNGTGKTTVLDVLAMLRNFAVRGLPCEGDLGGKTFTCWQDVAEQRFELDVKGNEGEYRYTLVVDQWHPPFAPPGPSGPRVKEETLKAVPLSSLLRAGGPSGPRVKQETLDFNGKPLFRFQEGTVGLFNDYQKPSPSVQFPFDWHRSGLATVEVGRKDNTKLTWFKRWLGQLVEVQINPWAMSARSERESRDPARDLGNFADWYRHLRLESGSAIFEAMTSLREAIPGLEALDAKEAGLDVRVLQATMRSPDGKTVNLPFSHLSEGQRALIALYVLLYCAVGEDRTLLIDEPDNFIALAEIQPWLVKLLDRVDEQNAQVILVSHHPELLDQLADQGGVLLDRPNGGETRVLPFEPPEDSGLKASEIIARGWEREKESMYGVGPSTIKELPKPLKHVIPTGRKRG